MRGEIIQLGAVRVLPDHTVGDEFQALVSPRYFKKMNRKIASLTGLHEARLREEGLPFPEAVARFRAWCGEDCAFLAWGFDDITVLRENLVLHGLDTAWADNWYNAQLIFNVQTNSGSAQKALSTALALMAFLKEHDPEVLHVKSFDGLTLTARLVTQKNARGTLLLFHGYRSTYQIDYAISAPFYFAQGFNLLLADERAHGDSEGRYITFGVRERRDVYTWVCEAAQRFGREFPFFLGGLSMGASTVLMASEYKFPANVRGIVADCGFTSPYEIQKSVLRARNPRLLAGPLLCLLGLYARVFAGFGLKEASTLEAVKKTSYPILFIHGSGDTFVPCRMEEILRDLAEVGKQNKL